jgi:hypothetical protein
MQYDFSRTMPALAIQAMISAVGLAILTATGPLLAAPAVSSVSGAMDHKGIITISGSGFGSKATAAPLAWDDATGSNLGKIWDGAWPNALPGYNTGYYSPMRGISPPHSHDTKYIAGAHAGTCCYNGAYAGGEVLVFKVTSLPSFPSYIYASWYQRADNEWVFGQDNNFKTFDYSSGNNPYASASDASDPYAANSWYINYGPPHPGSNTDTGAQWTIETGNPLLMNPDNNGHNAWWGMAVNPMAGKWSKVEIAFKVTNQSDGYVNVWENGHQVVGYAGPTDTYPGTQRTITIGGFARMRSPNNWRYYDDVYVDTTLSRVVLADKPALSQATIIENQIPSSWSDSSITATVNLGQFTRGQTAYLFVVDSSGTPSAKGLAVTAGGTVGQPNSPSNVAVH